MSIKGNLMNPSGRKPAMAVPHRVPTASNLKGQVAVARSTKTMKAGGFIASRKKGTIKGR